MGIWILSTIIVVIALIIAQIIKLFIAKFTNLKKTDLHTPLPEFRESNSVSTLITSRAINIGYNISKRFEEMCILHPLEHRNDPDLYEVISQYRDLLKGKIVDTNGEHIPSYKINGRRNPDYKTYIKAQKRAQSAASPEGLIQEAKDIHRQEKEDAVQVELMEKLIDKGLPVELVEGALREGKLNTYTAEDWVRFPKCIKEYLETYPIETVIEFVENFDNKRIIFDSEKIENYSIFRDHGVPLKVIKEIINDRISVHQAERALALVRNFEYDWTEAIEDVLEEDLKESQENSLRTKYRALIAK